MLSTPRLVDSENVEGVVGQLGDRSGSRSLWPSTRRRNPGTTQGSPFSS